jgi:hypothetical protein
MKTIYWILCAAVLGIVMGSASAKIRHNNWPIVTNPSDLEPKDMDIIGSKLNDGSGSPILEIKSTEFHFGALDIGKTGSHDFVFTNVGDGEMRLTPGPTSCSCTSTLFDGETLLPQESERIRVEWTAKEYPGEFTQVATIYTNDPRNSRVQLKVTGRFTSRLDASPREIILGNVTTGADRRGDFELYSYEEDDLEILGYEVNDPEHFEAEWTPLDESDLPEDSTGGYKVSVTVKSGLPIGAFSDELSLQTNSKAFPYFNVPIKGVATGQVTLFGARWDRGLGAARLDFIPAGREFEHRLMVRVGGPRWNETTLKVARTEPDWIEAELGDPIVLGENIASARPLIIRIPDDAPTCNFMGPDSENWAKVFLETSDPSSPSVRVLLRFAIGS